MSYNYAEQKRELFTEGGADILLKVRDNVRKLLDFGGAFTGDKAVAGCTGESWTMLAALDYLQERGEITKVSDKGWTQHHVYTKGPKWESNTK